jgi:uncharacterized protein (DUF2062 family)
MDFSSVVIDLKPIGALVLSIIGGLATMIVARKAIKLVNRS